MGIHLPGGFSPVNAIKQTANIAASATPFVNAVVKPHDYDVFSDVSIKGGTRSPDSGLIGPQVGGSAIPAYQPPYHPVSAANMSGSTTTTYQAAQDAAAQQAAADQAAYDSYRSEANNDLSRLLGSYNSTVANLKSNYQTQGNQLDSAKAGAQNTYNNNVTDQNQNLLRQDNQIRQGVHSAYQNLMNLLGAYGGGGTSVAQQWAPEAAQHFQNAQMGTANQTTAANLRDLNNNWGTYLNQWENQKKQLADQQNQDLTNAKSTYDDTKTKLNTILGRIGNPGIAPSDIAGQLSGISVPRVDFVKPTYTGTTPVYNAPNLSTFEAAVPTASFAQPAAVSNSSATPALAVLLDQQKRQQQQVA